jgi:hypothetical protein
MDLAPLRSKVLAFLCLEGDILLEPSFAEDYYTDLKVVKGEITKVFVRNEYVTYYEFKLFNKGIEAKQLRKRYSEFEELHHVNN